MSKRARGLVLIAAGVLLVLIAFSADALGVGAHPDFGWKQILGIIAGAGLAVMGLGDLRR